RLRRAGARPAQVAAAAGGRRRADRGTAAARAARPGLDLFQRSVRQPTRDHLLRLRRRRRAAAAGVDAPRLGSMSTKTDEVGALLLALVDRVSHRGGDTLALMTEAGLTLPQVLFLTRLRQAGESTPSELAERLNMSPPSV